ncbi:MAG: polysaccharide biosynthesis tyrosine autokinase [Solirubrobacteraceae bacterium]
MAVVWRMRKTALLVALWAMAGVTAATLALPKQYATSAYLIVNTNKPTSSNFEAQQVSQVDTQTAAQLLQTLNTANLVARALPYHQSPQAVQSKVAISAITNTQLVLITASGSSPLAAQQLANTYADVFTARTAPTVGFAKISVSEPAPLVQSPSSPQVKLYLLVGLILALGAGVTAAIVRDRLDDRLRIDPQVSELFGLPILARVPDVTAGRLRRRRLDDQDIRFVEGFRWVLANLTFVNAGQRPKVLAIASAAKDEGKSTVSLAIAHAADEVLDGQVLLVDGDMRHRSLSQLIPNGEAAPGLSDLLVRSSVDESGRSLPQSVPGTRLRVLTAGRHPGQAPALLGGRALSGLIRIMRSGYELVVIDTPPLRAGADAALVAAEVDGAVLVVDARRSRRSAVNWSIEQLRRADVNLLGIVINRAPQTPVFDYGYGRPPESEDDSRDGAETGAPVTLEPS